MYGCGAYSLCTGCSLVGLAHSRPHLVTRSIGLQRVPTRQPSAPQLLCVALFNIIHVHFTGSCVLHGEQQAYEVLHPVNFIPLVRASEYTGDNRNCDLLRGRVRMRHTSHGMSWGLGVFVMCKSEQRAPNAFRSPQRFLSLIENTSVELIVRSICWPCKHIYIASTNLRASQRYRRVLLINEANV